MRKNPARSLVISWLILCSIFWSSTAGIDPFAVTAPDKSRYGASWDNEKRADFAAFNTWAKSYLNGQNRSASSLSDGLVLAKQRRVSFGELLKTAPAQAIASAIPVQVREQLPPEINEQLEARVSGFGDYSVLAALRAKRGPGVDPVRRFVHLGGKTYRAYVYGRRIGETTKYGIPMHGVAMDGVIALHENALRALDLGEETRAKPITDVGAPASGSENQARVLAEMGGQIYRFASSKELLDAETKIEIDEAAIGPVPRRSAVKILQEFGRAESKWRSSPTPDSSYTEGNKEVLIIRVDFSDIPGDPQTFDGSPIYSADYVQNLADTEVAPFYLQSSYGHTTLTNTATTQLYRMPQTAEEYAVGGLNDQLHDDARAAAAADYDVESFDRVVVLFSWLGDLPDSQITYGGLAQVGAPHAWINGEFDFRVVAHELGHTYGLLHANLWQVTDGNPISPDGTSDEYGDDFDTMGANFADDPRTDFNPWFKNRLDWIPDAQVQTVTTGGLYRINRFDNSTGTGILAVKIKKDGNRNYWVGCRREFTGNLSMQHGAYVFWGYNTNRQSELLDTTTPGVSDQDAALAIGATLMDADAHVLIRPVAEGGSSPDEFIDVQIILGGSGVDSDFNGDGKSDILWQNSLTGARAIWLMNGTNHSSTVYLPAVGTDWQIVGAADFNADGKPDILWQNKANGHRAIWLMDGTSFSSSVYLPSASIAWEMVGANDFNSDGKPDILWQDKTNGHRAIWFLNGTSFSSSVYLPTVDIVWNMVGAKDLNGDAKPDIIWQDRSTGECTTWFMNGTSVTSSASLGSVPVAWGIAGSGDFNGDGKPDILWQNNFTGKRTIWLMNGTSVSAGATLGTVVTAWQIRNH